MDRGYIQNKIRETKIDIESLAKDIVIIKSDVLSLYRAIEYIKPFIQKIDSIREEVNRAIEEIRIIKQDLDEERKKNAKIANATIDKKITNKTDNVINKISPIIEKMEIFIKNADGKVEHIVNQSMDRRLKELMDNPELVKKILSKE